MNPLRPASLRAALELLTRLPVPAARAWRVEDAIDGAAWYPLVGALVGLGLAVVGLVSGHALGLDAPVAAVLVVLAGVVGTGGLHEDGLADAMDGLFGGWTVDRRLEIMRDSRVGSYGALALWGAMTLRWVALDHTPARQWLTALVLAHVLARLGGLGLLAVQRYARPDSESVAAKVVDGVGVRHLLAGTVLSALPLGALVAAGELQAEVLGGALAMVVGVCVVWGGVCRSKVGGTTGDLVGAGILLSELAVLVGCTAWLGG